MRLHGYCTECHKIKLITVSASSLNRMAARGSTTPMGVCSACQEDKK